MKMKLKFAFAILFLSAICFAQGPSTDRNNPTPMTSNTVEGEYEGAETSHHYRFIANKGEVKITATGETEKYSTLMDVELLDQSGSRITIFGVVAKEDPQTEVKTVTFHRKQPVTLRIFLREDKDIKYLKYQIRIDGAVEFEGAGMSGAAPAIPDAPAMPETSAMPTAPATPDAPAMPPMPADPAMPQTPSQPATPSEMSGMPSSIAGDDRLCLPVSGTLLLETTSGETFAVDLKTVVKASIKP